MEKLVKKIALFIVAPIGLIFLIIAVIFIIIAVISLLFSGINFLQNVWWGVRHSVRPGSDYIWFSILVFLAFLLWQLIGVRNFFFNWKIGKVSLPNRIVFYLCFCSGFLLMIYMWGELIVWNWADEPTKDFIENTRKNDVVNFLKGYIDSDEPFSFWTILKFLAAILISLLVAFIIGLHAYGFIFLGKIGTGAVVAIVAHNYLNGHGIDVSDVLEALFMGGQDLLEEWQGFLITVVWFFLSGSFVKAE